MSLTVFYRGKNIRYQLKLVKKQWLSILMILALGVVVSSYWTVSSSNQGFMMEYRIKQAQVENDEEKRELKRLKQQTEEQLTAMLMKLGELQGKMNRLEALGLNLAEQSDLNTEAFNFGEEPALGGPSIEVSELSEVGINNLIQQMDSMLTTLTDKEKQLLALESVMLNHNISNQSYVSGRPIKKGWLSSYFGVRKDPFSGMPTMHKGIDFAGVDGADVIATGAGVVTWSGERFGYGNLIEIDHGAGIKTRYGHNKNILVEEGAVITKGQVIAQMGSTGRSTGPHVHYEILRGNAQIDPIKHVYRKAK